MRVITKKNCQIFCLILGALISSEVIAGSCKAQDSFTLKHWQNGLKTVAYPVSVPIKSEFITAGKATQPVIKKPIPTSASPKPVSNPEPEVSIPRKPAAVKTVPNAPGQTLPIPAKPAKPAGITTKPESVAKPTKNNGWEPPKRSRSINDVFEMHMKLGSDK